MQSVKERGGQCTNGVRRQKVRRLLLHFLKGKEQVEIDGQWRGMDGIDSGKEDLQCSGSHTLHAFDHTNMFG